MKTTSILLGVIVLFTVTLTQLNAKTCSDIKELLNAAFKWQETVHDFGNIKRNVPVSYKFSFRNAGDSPLIVTTVNASCGCTVTEYTKEPIAPGGEGFVKATYNAASVGTFNKTVTVNANTGDPVLLSIKGVVVE